MSSLADAMKKLKTDKRLTDFFLKHNQLTIEEIQNSLNALEDSSANSEPINLGHENGQDHSH
jgi:hypothetical protein